MSLFIKLFSLLPKVLSYSFCVLCSDRRSEHLIILTMVVTVLTSLYVRTGRQSLMSCQRTAAALVSRTLHFNAGQKPCTSSFNRPGYLLGGLQVESRPLSTRPHPTVEKVIRVNHAGEYGAGRIYEGQASVLGKTKMIQVYSCAVHDYL